MIHKLKSWPEYFQDVIDGVKPFEIRNDDREYQVDDIVVLQEYDPKTETYSGREYTTPVTYIVGEPWLPPGIVALGIVVKQSTKALVEELKRREGVEEIEISPNGEYWVEHWEGGRAVRRGDGGPARILIVTD